ncbi:MAG: hypothetical protein JWQ98_379 [Chlorobi bacterium]|nr:hypothetical protein [Chlorobiota bacterium]
MNRTVIILIVIAMLAIGSKAMAQSASLTSSATIVTPIAATATAPLAFGTITKGQTSSVAATTGSAGAVTFSGNESDNITVPATATISTTSGAGAGMTVTIDRANLRGNTTTSGTGAVLNAASGSVTTALSSDAGGDAHNSDGLGQLYLTIGGSVAPAATQQRGSYSGTFTVSAAYSN